MAYGDHAMGYGHVVRSLALADSFRKRARSSKVFFITRPDRQTEKMLRSKNVSSKKVKAGEEQRSLPRFLDRFQPDVTVVDRLRTGRTWMEKIRRRTRLLVTLDNVGNGRLLADLVVNVLYRAKTPKSFAGTVWENPEYLVVRPEFLQTRKQKKGVPAQKGMSVLLAQGGSDTFGMTPRILKALLPLPKQVRLKVLLGPGYRHEAELERVLSRAKRPVEVSRSVTRMPSFLEKVDVAVTGAGVFLYELACLGIPSLVVTGEKRELETAKRCAWFGFTRCLGLGQSLSDRVILKSVQNLLWDARLRRKMGNAGQNAVDGRGAERIVRWVLERKEKLCVS